MYFDLVLKQAGRLVSFPGYHMIVRCQQCLTTMLQKKTRTQSKDKTQRWSCLQRTCSRANPGYNCIGRDPRVRDIDKACTVPIVLSGPQCYRAVRCQGINSGMPLKGFQCLLEAKRTSEPRRRIKIMREVRSSVHRFVNKLNKELMTVSRFLVSLLPAKWWPDSFVTCMKCRGTGML